MQKQKLFDNISHAKGLSVALFVGILLPILSFFKESLVGLCFNRTLQLFIQERFVVTNVSLICYKELIQF